MTLPVYGNSISLNQVQNEFGGSNPISLTEYYAGGSYVTAQLIGYPAGVATYIPSSGTISLSNFLGARYKPNLYYSGASSVTTVDGETLLIFNGSGGHVRSVVNVSVRALVVGGGGSGGGAGNNRSGGGGGGGVIDQWVTISGTPSYSPWYSITVGDGGAAASGTNGASGGYSSFAGLTAYGGSGGLANQGAYGYGSTGGAAGSPTNFSGGANGGGGGGAGGAAPDANGTGLAPNAGIGKASNITGPMLYYGDGGGGGSGCSSSNNGGAGGTGGWSIGYNGGIPANSYGMTNRGGGGGGGCQSGGGGGGSGVVIVRGYFRPVAE